MRAKLAPSGQKPNFWMALLLVGVGIVACSDSKGGTSHNGSVGGSTAAGGSRANTTTASGGISGSGGSGAGGNLLGGAGGNGQASGGSSATTAGTGGTIAAGGTSGAGGTGSGGQGSGTGGGPTGTGGPTGGQTMGGTGGVTSSTGGRPGTGGAMGAGGMTGAGGAMGTGGTTASSGGTDCPFTNEVMGWATQSGTVTGGGNATPTVVSSLSALNDAAKGTNAAVIQISGTISGSVSIGSSKTLMGACGSKATIKGHIQMSGSKNVIMRNLTIVGNNCSDSPSDCSSGEDAITVVSGANHLWFDHCDISDGSDGNLDMTHAADFITISWTKFHYSGRRSGDHQFCNLIGHTDDNAAEDSGHLNVTFDHVWWADNVAQRMPRVRFGKVHVVNSLYSASGNDNGVGVGVDCNIRVENNVFSSINSAFYFNNDNSASIAESIGNSFKSSSGTAGRGTSFKPPYTYPLENISTVEASVRAGAGTK
jgi:pectate lyase